MNGQTGSGFTAPFASRRRPVSRRRFLRGSAVAMALPFLESMGAPFARASVGPVPRRMFCICNNLGVLPRPFFPSDAGRAYTPSPYPKLLEEPRAGSPGPAPDVLHLQHPRRATPTVLPERRGPRLHPLAVPEAPGGAPRRLHRAQ